MTLFLNSTIVRLVTSHLMMSPLFCKNERMDVSESKFKYAFSTIFFNVLNLRCTSSQFIKMQNSAIRIDPYANSFFISHQHDGRREDL